MTAIAEPMAQHHASSGEAHTNRVAPSDGFSWPMVFGGFVVVAGVAIARAILTTNTTPLLNDTDDAMRLTTVRDLMAGQGWWDHIERRLDVPYGGEIHWSHLPDAAIGGLIRLFSPFGPMAETIAVYVWPTLLLLALLTLCARLAYALGGREAMLPAIILPLLSPALMTEFSPGRIDHHSIQILMTLLMAWGAIEAITRPRFAILAGLAGGMSFAIGVEGLPSIISAIIAIALAWVLRPERADALRWYGLSLGLSTVAAMVETWPPSRWLDVAFDEISIVYVAFAVGVGAILVLLSLLPLGGQRPWVRLVAGGVLAALLAVGLGIAFPQWREGPYAGLDPWLVHNWLDNIAEAKPIWESARGFDAFTIGIAVPPLLGLGAITWRLWKGPAEKRGEWLVLGLFLLIAVAVTCVQVRGARLATPLALPAAGWVIAAARQRYLSGERLTGALGMIGGWLGFSGLIVAIAVVLIHAPFTSAAAKAADAAAASEKSSCLMPNAFTALAALPPARIMAPVDLGSHLLAFTHDSVVAAPYQRAQRGVADAMHFFNNPIGSARAILAARGVTLVVVCPALPEMQGLPEAAPDSFVKLYAAGRLPDWLLPIGPPGGPLKIYRVVDRIAAN